ncbi:WD repeat-containing protein wat1 [Trypanosoma rangeli]|uniref:WD repeat-containing protein wat1 n=1 Tax=Trypanosoma rangeli TaxID=5698 RepID=A0A422NHB1_TRYRA|nr:WD repeat-containing protein wat1 [Trypanosoma rangeli]RNF04860.1 WD repeat-containing protein wat1 [Trypanosoma rangeli]|eukprot:RNF04860.1 WD repeat-containing protein wat1 [Trypanosoma rangeli]
MCAAFLISASYDKQIRFWDGASGRTVRCFSFQDSQVNALLLIPDTTYLVVAGFGLVRVYDIGAPNTAAAASGGTGGGTNNQAPPIMSSYENQSAMNFTSLGSFPLHLKRGVISFFGSSNENSTSSFLTGTVDLTSTLRLSQDDACVELSTALYATSEDGHIRFFNATNSNTLQLIWDISTNVAITCSALSPDRQTLFTGSQIGRVSVWHLPTIMEVATQQMQNTDGILYGQKPLQEIAFDTDYTAIRSIAVEPLARWAVAATNAGKLHFLRFLKKARGSGSSTEPLPDNETKLESGGAMELKNPMGGAVNTKHRKNSADRGANAVHDVGSFQLEGVCRPTAVGNEVDAGGLKGNVFGSCAQAHGEESQTPAFATPELKAVQPTALFEDQKTESEEPSKISFPKQLPALQQFLMEVFYSFQAHYKYILKVAISPSTDLLVTCCADYTVGRFLIPKELQQGTAFEARRSGDDIFNGQENENTMSAAAPMSSEGVDRLQARRMAQPRAPEVALAVASLLQPMAGEEDSQCGSADKPNGAEAKTLETSQSGTGQKGSSDADERIADGSAAKTDEKASASPADFADASLLQFSVVQSLNIEDNTQLHSTGVLKFIALKPLTGHLRWVWDCVFSDCGRYLFTASSDHYLRMWTGLLTDRVQSTCFIGHTKPVVCCILYYEKRW